MERCLQIVKYALKLLLEEAFMKRLILGALIFVFILGFFIMKNNIELAMNVTGIIGISGALIGGF